MKLLLDEMLSPVVAERLRERGHDAEAISGSEHAGLPDSEVMDLARRQGRAVVTNNLADFRPLHHEAVAAGHHGMVFVPSAYRRTARDVGRIVAALEAVLAEHPRDEDLAGGETWI